MNQSTARETPAVGPVVTVYFVVGFAALAVLGAALMQSGADRWSLVPTLIGTAGMVFRWRIGPLALIVSIAFGIILPSWIGGGFSFRRVNPVALDAVLCFAVLVYLIAQYRLMSLQVAVLPPDPRCPRQPPPARDPAGVPVREAPTALLVAVATTVGALFLWELTALVRPLWGMAPSYWRVSVLVWLVALGLIGLGATIGYFGWRRQSRAEALMTLRDEYWRQTRGEQRRINRWRAWARRRHSG